MTALLLTVLTTNLMTLAWLWRLERRRQRRLRRPRQVRVLGGHVRLVSVPHRERSGS